ncbi:MAG: alpha/beta hydrolase [Verrucomicrobia bacterium]|nr:alpha/beta hydrolase [Verrucomicrobiota bacterium]
MKRLLIAFIAVLLCAGSVAPVRAQFKPEVQFAQVGQIKMAYYKRGQGEPLLMINGFLSTMSLWDPLMIEVLAQQHQLILFDNRGVGLSTDTQENLTTIPQMADDAAGLIKALGYKKVNVLAYSMGARIGQQLLIRHPELVNKAVLCAADPGGSHHDPAAADVEAKLNNPNTPELEKIALTFTNDEAGRQAAKEALSRIKSAVAAGTMPNDFQVSKETIARQDRARTVLWNKDNQNFEGLKNIKVPVLVTDGRSDVIDRPKNSLIIANQIPFAWLAFFEGGHAFLYQSPKKFADTVNVFLQ